MFEKLAQKPDYVKRNIAFVSALVITGVIVLAWIITPDSRIDSGAAARGDVLQPFKTVQDEAKFFLNNVVDRFKNLIGSQTSVERTPTATQ